MSETFKIVLCIVILCFWILIFKLVSSKSLSLKYSLMWIASCVVLVILVAFPQLLESFSVLIGVELPVNALFTVAIFCLLLVLLSITVIISKQTVRIRELAQANALLEERVRALEKLGKE